MKKRKQKRTKRLSFLLIILIVLLVHMRLIAPNAYKMRVEVVESVKLPENFGNTSIAYFSDLYDDTDNFKKAIKDIKTLKPDLIIFGGNLSEETLDKETKKLYEKELKELKAPLGKFTVMTEKDIQSGQYSLLENAGFTSLNTSGLPIYRDQQSLYLVSYDKKNEAIQVDDNVFSICVSQSPEDIPDIKSDLVLTGKNLGGQIILPFLGPLRNDATYYQKRYDKKSQTILISQGLGTLDMKMRLGTRPELVMILLERDAHES